MAGSVVVTKKGVVVLPLLEEGVDAANQAMRRQVAMLSHSEPRRLDEDMKIMVSFIANGPMIIWRIKERMEELFKRGVNLVGYDLGVGTLDGKVACGARYVLITDMNGVYLQMWPEEGRLKGYVKLVTTTGNLRDKLKRLKEGERPLEIARKYLGWVSDQFRLGIDAKGAEVRILEVRMDLDGVDGSDGLSVMEFEFSV